MDDFVFSSTQQMHNDLAGPADDAAGEVSSPRGGKFARRGGGGGRGAGQHRGGRGGRGGRAAAAAMPAVAEEQEEDEQEEAVAALQRQEGQAPGFGSDTQAVSPASLLPLRGRGGVRHVLFPLDAWQAAFAG